MMFFLNNEICFQSFGVADPMELLWLVGFVALFYLYGLNHRRSVGSNRPNPPLALIPPA
jgi:hypothetical protein